MKTTKQLYTYKSIDNKDIKTDCTNEQMNFPPSKLVGIKADFVADVASKIGVDTLTTQDALKIVIAEGFIGLNARCTENKALVLDIKDHSFNRSVALNTRNIGNNPAIIEAFNNLVKKAEAKADTKSVKSSVEELNYIAEFNKALNEASKRGVYPNREQLKAKIDTMPKSVQKALTEQFLPVMETTKPKAIDTISF